MLSKKQATASYLLAISCCAIFLLSTGIKSVYTSALISIREEFGISYTQTRIGSLLYYCIYGSAQILLALFYKKINIKKLFLPCVILTSICYSFMTVASAPWKLWLILAICGILDAPLWSGCIYFVGKFLQGKYIAKANAILSLATPLGLALAYGVVALFVSLGLWKVSFLFLSVLMFLSAVLFKLSENNANKTLTPIEPLAKRSVTASAHRKGFYLLVVIYVAIFVGLLNGARYTMNQIVPEMIFDVYAWPETLSVLVTVVLPLINAVMNVVTSKMFEKGIDYLTIALIVAVISLFSAIGLYFIYDAGVVWFIIMSVIFTSCMSVISQIFIGFFPLVIGKKFSAGAAGAMNNGCAAVSSGVMPFISAMLLDGGGNNARDNVYLLMLGISLVVGIMIATLVFTRKKNDLLTDD